MSAAAGDAVARARDFLASAPMKVRTAGVAGAGLASAQPAAPSPETTAARGGGSGRPSVLSLWNSGAGGAAAPGGTSGPSAPLSTPPLSPGLRALAVGLAGSVARFNAAAVALTVRHFASVQPPKITEEQIDGLSEAWVAGLEEILATNAVTWWHFVLLANGTLAIELYQNAKPLGAVAASAVPPQNPSPGAS